jgi:hypothetical protein
MSGAKTPHSTPSPCSLTTLEPLERGDVKGDHGVHLLYVSLQQRRYRPSGGSPQIAERSRSELPAISDLPSADASAAMYLRRSPILTTTLSAAMTTPSTTTIKTGMSQMLSNTQYLSHIFKTRSARRSYQLLGVARGTPTPFLVVKDMRADQPAADIVLHDEGLTVKNLNLFLTWQLRDPR